MGLRTLSYILLTVALTFVLSPGRTLSAAQPAPAACTEQVTDGGFEAGGTAWQTTSAGGFDIISQIMPYAGDWGAYMGGYNNANDELAQGIVLPAGNAITLSFWWQMMTQETTHFWDTLDVTIAPAGGGTAVRVAQITDGSVANAWQQTSVDLSAYAGQSVRLAFVAQTDSDRPTDFYLDDISVSACASTGSTATPTATLTATVTPTATTTYIPPVTPTMTVTPTAAPTATPTSPGMRLRIYLPLVMRLP